MAQDILADGFVRLCVDPSLNYYDGLCRVLVEGQMLATGTATPDKLIPVPTDRDLDTLFGAGSVLAETLKKMFCTCKDGIRLFAIPRIGVGTAAEYTITFAGPVTADGRVEIFLLDRDYSVDFLVEATMTMTEVGDAFVAELPDDFPYTATNAAGVVTLVSKNLGDDGNVLHPIFNWRGLQNYAPAGLTVTSAQTVVGAGHLTPLDYRTILGDCCYTCFTLLDDGADYQKAWQLYLESLWSCDTPQCFGHGYTYNEGTLGQILARGSNAAVFSRIAICEDEISPKWLQAGAYAALSCCTACDSPELSIQGQNYGRFDCLHIPETCSNCWDFDEEEQLKAAGFVVTGPVVNGTGVYTSPYVYNDVTNYLYDAEGRPNVTFRDTNSRRLTAATGVAIATELQRYNGLGLYTENTQIKEGIFGTNPRLLLAAIRAWAKDQIGVLFSEFDNLDEDIILKTDFEVTKKCQGDPNKLHLWFKYRPPVRIGRIMTNLIPRILDNCSR